jgi:hypothetical protein
MTMLTQVEITVYAEEIQCADQDTEDECLGQWQQVQERQPFQLQENWHRVAEWYREYEEETGTMLGCD